MYSRDLRAQSVNNFANRMSKDSYYISLSANAKKVISLDLDLLIAETKCCSEFEQWLKEIIKEIQITKTYILLIDEVHTLIGQVR